MPRATTAACEVLPPRLVRMPRATTMPCRSSGLVSLRTRMTSSPLSAHSTAVAESNTALPTAAPGEAFMPLASSVRSAFSSNRGNISWASWAPVTRRSASSRSIRPSSTMSHRDPERRLGGALADPGLQHPELAALDGELDVAHVAVVLLERAHDLEQLVVRLLVDLLQVGERHGVADAGHDVLALRVLEVVAVHALGAGRRVAGERDARAGVHAAVAEHHRLHVDRGAEVLGDPLLAAVERGRGRCSRSRRPRGWPGRAARAGPAGSPGRRAP